MEFSPSDIQIINFLEKGDGFAIIMLWCKLRIQKFIDINMNSENSDIFHKLYNREIRPCTFNIKDWKTNDMSILKNTEYLSGIIKKISYENRSKIVNLIRMTYFVEFSMQSSKGLDISEFKQLFLLVDYSSCSKRRHTL